MGVRKRGQRARPIRMAHRRYLAISARSGPRANQLRRLRSKASQMKLTAAVIELARAKPTCLRGHIRIRAAIRPRAKEAAATVAGVLVSELL